MPIIKMKHGGAIFRAAKGETKNPNGRPKVPKTIKEFIKDLENVKDDIVIPADSCSTVLIKGVKYYKIKNTSGHKMAMAAYNKALKGDIRYLDWLTKMGYGGGYEATKVDQTVTERKVTWQETKTYEADKKTNRSS